MINLMVHHLQCTTLSIIAVITLSYFKTYIYLFDYLLSCVVGLVLCVDKTYLITFQFINTCYLVGNNNPLIWLNWTFIGGPFFLLLTEHEMTHSLEKGQGELIECPFVCAPSQRTLWQSGDTCYKGSHANNLIVVFSTFTTESKSSHYWRPISCHWVLLSLVRGQSH